MESKIILESFFNAIDIGTVFEAITKYKRRSWNVNHKKIIKYMITGKGYTNLTPPQTSRLLLEGKKMSRFSIFGTQNLIGRIISMGRYPNRSMIF